MNVILKREWPMTAGTTPKQADLWRGTAGVCEGRVGQQSIWVVLDRPQGRRRPGDSTVDPDARHGHKTSARGFDGYKGHSVDDAARARRLVGLTLGTTDTGCLQLELSTFGSARTDCFRHRWHDPVGALSCAAP